MRVSIICFEIRHCEEPQATWQSHLNKDEIATSPVAPRNDDFDIAILYENLK